MNDRIFCQEYFFAIGLTGKEFNEFLNTGWRRFGYFFFRPQCDKCVECIPIRVKVNDFQMTMSQKRVFKKNANTRVFFKELDYRDEIFDIYKEHSADRFGQEANKEDFIRNFFISAVHAIQSEYYVNDQLAAVGFIDITDEALSSVYFIYKTEFNYLSFGTLSVIKEIEYARELGFKYYYLGYYIKENLRMAYKSKFYPYELYDWKNKIWS